MPEEDTNNVIDASQFATVADECHIMEELSVQQVVSIVTDVQVESNDEQDEEGPFVAATVTAIRHLPACR